MQRWSALALVGILIASAMLLVFRVGSTRPLAVASASSSASAEPSGSAAPPGSGAPPAAGSALVPALAYDAEPPPPKPVEIGSTNLPEGAPKTVVFGVILLEYRGAQGASRSARTREAADALAKDLAEEARKDFAAAVAKGDPGSTESAGTMPRGVLEPGPEQTLFTLPVGEVGGPIDTPRGLWIVKRIE